MINFDYRTKDGKISAKYEDFLQKIDTDPSISDYLGAALIDLNGFIKAISLCNGKINEITVGSDDSISLFANFQTAEGSNKRVGKTFDISATAIEKNPRQCMSDRKYLFRQYAVVFDGTRQFFKNTSNAVQLVNKYFDATEFGASKYTVEEFAEIALGKGWEQDPRKVAYVKVLEATCGVTKHGDLGYNYSAIYNSLVETMEMDKEFQPRTKPDTRYVENKVTAIETIQAKMFDTVKSLENVRVDAPCGPTGESLGNYVTTMLELSAEEIENDSFLEEAIDAPYRD